MTHRSTMRCNQRGFGNRNNSSRLTALWSPSLSVKPFMHISHIITLILSVSGTTLIGAEPLAHVDAFSKLKAEDSMIVSFRTSGCFHDATYEFTFHRAEELSVDVVQLPTEIRGAWGITNYTERVALGTLTLSKSDIAGLDKSMEFYRSKHRSFCTTIDRISFTQRREGKTVAVEQITDDSCAINKVKGVTRFSELIGRLSVPKR
jgi:hypothetical protein